MSHECPREKATNTLGQVRPAVPRRPVGRASPAPLSEATKNQSLGNTTDCLSQPAQDETRRRKRRVTGDSRRKSGNTRTTQSTIRKVRTDKNWPSIRNNLSMLQLRQKGAEKQRDEKLSLPGKSKKEHKNKGSKPAGSREPSQGPKRDTTKRSRCRLRQKRQTQGAARRHGLFWDPFQDRARVFPVKGA